MKNRLAATFAFVLAVSVCAPAQTAPAAAVPHGYRIAGRVVDSVTGDPVARVVVNIVSRDYQGSLASAVTGPDGRFTFDNVPAGKYPLNASKRGYRSAYYDEHEGYNSAIVTGDGLVTDHLEFHLAPAAVLHGVVTDDAGDPVESAQVMLFRQPVDTDTRDGHVEQVGSNQTDDTGAYEFAGLPTGEYFVAVSAEPWYAQHRSIYLGESSEPSPLDVAYPMTFYDSTPDEAAATPIQLEAGSSAQADISLHAVAALHFRLPTLPHEGNRFLLEQRVFGNSIPVGFTEQSSGNHLTEISGVAPGSYEAEVGDPPRHMVLNASSNEDISLTGGTPTLALSGTLSLAAGGPLPAPLVVTLASQDGHRNQATEADHGSFHFDDLLPGAYTVGATSGDQTLAVISTTTGAGSAGAVISPGGHISLNDHPLTLAVTLTRAQVNIQGFARNGNAAAPGAMIVLVPADPRNFPALVRRDQSDSDGSFELRGVAPGTYAVVAIQDGWKIDWQDRQVLAPYLRGGMPVTVPEQAEPTLRLAHPVPVVQRSP